jgi:hypothetical protein
MARVITVHGTFAGDASSRGEKWWQQGSPFTEALQDLIEEPLDFEPFHWSGANSEMDRRRTGARLASEIRRQDEPPIVIGHSHGGSTAIQALLLLFLRQKQKGCDHIRGVITIGTPMLIFRSNRNPFSRFDVTGRLALLFAVGLLLIKGGDIALDEVRGGEFATIFGLLRDLVFSVQFALAALIVGVLTVFGRRNMQRARLFRTNQLYECFADHYAALNHSQDEAINGLRSARVIKPKLVKIRKVFVLTFSTLAFVLVGIFFLLQVLTIRGAEPPEVLAQGFEILDTHLIVPADGFLHARLPELSETRWFRRLLSAFSIVPVAVVIIFSAIVAFLTALVVTPGLSGFVSDQIKTQSFGDDGFGETISKVAAGLDFKAEEIGTLPQDVEDEMVASSVDDAGRAIQRIRELLSSGELLSREGADLMAQSMRFEKSELLHNAYFHSPLFIRYLAATMIARFGLTPSAAFQQDRAGQVFLRAVGSRL